MITVKRSYLRLAFGITFAVFLLVADTLGQRRLHGQSDGQTQNHPWMDTSLSPDQRADMVLKEMTLEEKIDLVHGEGMPGWGKPRPNAYLGNGGAGFVLAIPRLGIPFIQMSDAAYGVRSSAQNGRYSTALPSKLRAPRVGIRRPPASMAR